MARVATFCGFLLAAALSGCIIQPFDADCPTDAIDDCERCQEHAGCGWCDGVGCIAGTSVAPDDIEACGANEWYFNDCDSPAFYCNDTCSTSRDGVCDEPRLCDWGTDCTDCRDE